MIRKTIVIFILTLMILCTFSIVYGDNENLQDSVNKTDATSLITIGITGKVTHIKDDNNVLSGKIMVNLPINGYYKYETTATDIDPHPNGAAYWYLTPPSCFVLNIGIYSFMSDPFNVEVGLTISDNWFQFNIPNYPVYDKYQFYSINNIIDPPLPAIQPGYQMGMKLYDGTANAINSLSIPLTAPVLGDWLDNMIWIYYSDIDPRIWGEINSISLTTPPIPPGPSGLPIRFAGSYRPIKFKMDIDDPELDRIRLGLDWGDGNMEWTGYNQSGITLEVEHLYEIPGIYEVRAMAEDEFGLQSEWSNPIRVSVFPGGGIFDWLLNLLFPD
jgi:hypothetical protein